MPFCRRIGVFTGKISKEMPEEFLQVIHKMYLEKHGHGVRNLDEFKVTIAAHELFAQKIPNLYEQNGRVSKPLVPENFQELEARGFLRKGEPLWYHLTPEGYHHAEQTPWQRFVNYWNSNPGLNTLVAIASAVFALISLGVAILALSNSAAQTQPLPPAAQYRVVSQ